VDCVSANKCEAVVGYSRYIF